MLMCRFNEFRGNIEVDDIEREFEYIESFIRQKNKYSLKSSLKTKIIKLKI